MRRAASLLALVLLAATMSGCLQGSLVGQSAPRFEIVTSLGERVNESTYLGRFVILDLMATWCAPCRLEIAHLQEIQRAYGDRVAILSIGADPTETDAELDAFAIEHEATWAHGLDRDGSMGRAYNLGIIPKLVILDPQGVVVFEREGEVLPAAMARVIDPGGDHAEPRSPSLVFAGAILAGVVGFLAVLNPYRRLHRDGAPRAAWLAFGGFIALSLLAWRAGGLVSSRATYGSLAIGIASLAAVGLWWRARRKETDTRGGHPALQAGERMYEAAPHFALALVLGLSAPGLAGFALPLAGFLAGYGLGITGRGTLPEGTATKAGLVGLALAGVGLLVFGSRILFA